MARRGSELHRAGLGRGCTLMQWFILFGLRPSWTSSIIVIHRRKWAARGGAGAGGSPPLDSQSLADTLAASTREPRCTLPSLDAFSIGPRVCATVPSPWSEIEARLYRVQCSRSQCASSDLTVRVQRAVSEQWTAARDSRRLSWPARLPANARWVRSITACTRSTSLCVYFESLAKQLPIDRMYASRTSPADSCQTLMVLLRNNDLCQVSSRCRRAGAASVLINSVGLLRKWVTQSRCYVRPWNIVLSYKLTRLSSVMRWTDWVLET